MEFGILGPLAVWQDGRELELGAAKQRALLAVFLLHPGETMTNERLVDALWGERPPTRAVKALQVYVSQLRKSLGEGVLETRRLGYALEVDDGALDLQRFERLLAEGRGLLGEGDPEKAGAVLREALALWRGDPLADFRYEPFAANAIGRLEELRLIALEQRLEADLAAGRHDEAVPELESLVRDHPLRESLRGLLMRALYGSGRQADALAVMQDTRTTLRDELGLDPGQPLQQLEKAILVQDPSLDPAVPRRPPARPERTGSGTVDLATPAHAEVGARAQRKVVTVVFADVAGSTELGESLDPEALRSLLAAYFERMKAAAERHGGVVEKFIGDAVMAVFGVPTVHEDDALRALRAAVEMREAMAELELEGRIGVESGEVVVGTAERLVTGRAVTTAARLEQSAQAGEILVGEATMELAGETVQAEALAPLTLQGKPEPVPAWRLLSVSTQPPLRDFDSPFVGRAQELRSLCQTWDRVRAEARCELVTVVGAAGVGKSRLVAELLSSIDCEVGQGRCLSYGVGVTYWPLVEAITQLRPTMPDEALPAPLRALVDDEGSASTDELAWAFRKFVETVAREHPLVLVFDDIQWAEEALLDLIEHVAFVSSGTPILLVCMARPELLDRRPGWRGVLRLEPLTPQEAEQLIRTRLGTREQDPTITQRIVVAADGNPLFVQELAAMLQDAATDELMPVPPTIQAVLAARLDQLDADERTVLESAAIEGEVFHLGAVQALTPTEERLTARLTALVRKEFVHPERSVLEGEDGFRFRHLLLRDATYDAIPKATRCGLHERYADWLGRHSAGLDAFIGYHLERAYRYRVDLRDTSTETDALARRASEHLKSAAAGALGRSDLRAAVGFLERAASPPPVPDTQRARLLTDLAATLMIGGELSRAEQVLGEVKSLAAAADDDCVRARLLIEFQFLDVHRAEAGATKGVPAIVKQVIPILEHLDDQHGLCRAWRLQASADWMRGRVSAAAEAWEQAAEHARQAGEVHQAADIRTWLASATFFGTTPVDAAIRRCTELRSELNGHPTSEAEILRILGGLNGLAGRFEHASSLFAESNGLFQELGLELDHLLSHPEAMVEMLAGDFAAAERRLRRGYEAYEAMGEKGLRSTTAAHLARAILQQGRHEEAEWFTEVAEQLGEPDDLATQILWRGVRARALARRGYFGDAETLAREAVALSGETDLVLYRADALGDLADVLEACGHTAEASATFDDAIRLYEAKGDTAAADAARARLHV